MFDHLSRKLEFLWQRTRGDTSEIKRYNNLQFNQIKKSIIADVHSLSSFG